MYKEQWRKVQYLDERFLTRWKQEYLHTLQPRRKWQYDQTNLNLAEGSRESHKQLSAWNGMVENTICVKGGHVRKAEVRITKNGLIKIYK